MSDTKEEALGDNSKKIIFFVHCSKNEPVFNKTINYCKRFPDVEVRQVSDNLPPFPKNYAERTSVTVEAWTFLEQSYFDAFKAEEKEGYGAVISSTGADFGVKDARNKLSIPAVGLRSGSCTKAKQLGKRFSFLHPNLISCSMLEKSAIDDGFADLFVSVEHFDFGDVFALVAGYLTPDFDGRLPVAMKSLDVARKKGAELILLGCGSPDIQEFAPLLNQESLAKYGIPVLTPIDTAVEVARSMIAGRK